MGAKRVSDHERTRAERLARGVDRAARLGAFRPRCLARALALSRLLTAHGIDGHHIRIGVRRDDGGFVAHAWVELGDLVLGDTRARTAAFVPLTDLRSTGGRTGSPASASASPGRATTCGASPSR